MKFGNPFSKTAFLLFASAMMIIGCSKNSILQSDSTIGEITG